MGLTSKGKEKVKKGLLKHAQIAMAFIAGRAVNEILNATPAETPGRMQAAWIAAYKSLTLPDAVSEHGKALSEIEALHKSEAADEVDLSWGEGESEVAFGKQSLTVTIRNTLEFASTVEHGGMIHVGVDGNVGPKINKIFPGQLGGPRRASGHGFLRWVDEAGTTHIDTSRQMSGTNSIAKAIPKAKQVAKKFGFK